MLRVERVIGIEACDNTPGARSVEAFAARRPQVKVRRRAALATIWQEVIITAL